MWGRLGVLPEVPSAGGGTGEARRFAYRAPLDGLRAFAVLGVMAYHGGITWTPGGFLGVDAFFVISGYLITSLLVNEWGEHGTIRLRSFWARRARRLLPALFLMIVAVAVYAAVAAPLDTLGQLRSDALATLAYVANWHQIVSGQGYFAQQALPSPLLHTWSLAIEEQFYLLWPLALLLLLRWRRSVRLVLAVTVVATVGSVLEMAMLFHPAHDTARLYYGTDTRAQSLLIGVALALVLVGREPARRAWSRLLLTAGAGIGILVTAWAWSHLDGNSSFVFRGGFALCGLAFAAVIAGVVQVPDSFVARALSFAPLRYVGRISYGLYLWHWPVYLIVDHTRTGLTGTALLAVRFAVTFALAIVSYHLIEAPIRRGALRNWRAVAATPAAALGVVLGVVLATASAPPALAAAPTLHAENASSTISVSQPPPLASQAPTGTSQTGPIRLLVVGDSVAETLADGLQPLGPQYGMKIFDAGTVGCGVARGGPYNDRGVVGVPLARCDVWPQTWTAAVNIVNPDVVAVVVGRWETLDRVHDGQYRHLGDPDFDAYIESELETAVNVASGRGAHVAFLTSPYFQGTEKPDGSAWPQDDPARVQVLNSLLAAVAANHPGVVSVVPLGAILDPGDHFSEMVDGIQVRFSDGVHITPLGGAWLAPKILPSLLELGEQTRGLQSVPVTPPATSPPKKATSTPKSSSKVASAPRR
jgi:peptidoglycan/LPS O-acetylase OafA/YrhL